MDLEHWGLKYIDKRGTFQNQEGYWCSYLLSKCSTEHFSGACENFACSATWLSRICVSVCLRFPMKIIHCLPRGNEGWEKQNISIVSARKSWVYSVYVSIWQGVLCVMCDSGQSGPKPTLIDTLHCLFGQPTDQLFILFAMGIQAELLPKSSWQVTQCGGSVGQIAIGNRITYIVPVINVKLTSKYSQPKSTDISQNIKCKEVEQQCRVSYPFNGSLILVINV